MGCCESKLGNGGDHAKKAAKWRSTGIVALRDCKLKVIPREAVQIASRIRTLDATHNKFAVLPPEIGDFVNLQRLTLSLNRLEKLPPSIGNLRQLKVLALDNNRLEILPEEVGLLNRLEKLSLSGNSLNALPDVFGKMLDLVMLDVAKNQLKGLPGSLGNCQALEELEASDNMIEELPATLGNLNRLKSLRLDGNHLEQLPPQLLKDTAALQFLSLHRNPIEAKTLQQMEGFQEYEARRKRKFDKQLDANVMLDSKGLDEGIDLKLL